MFAMTPDARSHGQQVPVDLGSWSWSPASAPGFHELKSSSITEKGPTVRIMELPVLRKHAIDKKKCLWRVVPVITAAAVSASLVAATAGPASTAVRPPTAPIISVSGGGRPAVALRTALTRVRRTGDGQFTLASAGLSSPAQSVDSALVAALNKVQRQAGTLDLASGNVVDTADTVPAASQGTTVITIVPGTTLTISDTEVVLDISPQDVTDIENAAALGSAIASLVGAILSLTPASVGGPIAAIVANSLNIGSDVLKLCAGNDGGSIIISASVPSGELPSVSACGVSV